jgi:hypothetical protein
MNVMLLGKLFDYLGDDFVSTRALPAGPILETKDESSL